MGKVEEYRQKLLNKAENKSEENTKSQEKIEVKSNTNRWKERAKERSMQKNNNIVMTDAEVKNVVEDVAIESKSTNNSVREVSEFDRFKRENPVNKELNKLDAFEKEPSNIIENNKPTGVSVSKSDNLPIKEEIIENTKEIETQSNFYNNSLDKKVEEAYIQSSETQVNDETKNIHTIEQNKHIQIENLERGSVRKSNTVNGGIGSNPNKDEAFIKLSCMMPEHEVSPEEIEIEPRTVLRAETEYKLAYVPVGVCKVIHEIIVAEVADTLVLGDKEYEVVLKPSRL